MRLNLFAAAAAVLVGSAVGAEPAMKVTVVDLDTTRAGGSATIGVELSDIEMVDPASVNERVERGEGHLHYRVGEGPVVATTATRLSFHELPPGEHRIEVTLVGNNHQPIGPREVLEVTVPASKPR
jgi:hypothetical protein